jgi:heptosyltransferase-2
LIDYKNILVIQTAFIGDAILASSIVEKLHHVFPSAQISILVRKGNESLYDNHPFLKEVLVWNKKEGKYSSLFSLAGTIRKRKFDAVINLHRYSSSGFLTVFSGAKHLAGYKQNFFSFYFNVAVKHIIGDGRHETQRYNQLIEDFTDAVAFKPKLYPSLTDEEKVKPFINSEFVTFSPASVWFTKQLPESKWIELGNRTGENTTIYLLGAKGDIELCQRIASQIKNRTVKILAGELSLLQSCALMKYAKMNYVNDSAPLHLASSVNAPVTAFFCSTVPAFGFGPLSDQSKVIEVKELYCKPCGLHGYKSCPEGHFKCGLEIDLNNA